MARYGSGSIFPRGKQGILYYQAWVDGRQIGPFSSRSTDQKVAQRELDKLLGKRARGEIGFSPKRVNIASILDDYLKQVEGVRTENTAKEYRNHIENQLKPYFGKLKPEKLTTPQLQKYREKRARTSP
jgi:hypothetical protein